MGASYLGVLARLGLFLCLTSAHLAPASAIVGHFLCAKVQRSAGQVAHSFPVEVRSVKKSPMRLLEAIPEFD